MKIFNKNKPSGILMIIVAEIIWGIGTVILDLSLDNFPIALMLGLRGLIAGVLLSFATHRYWKTMRISDVIQITISSWVGLSFMQFIFTYGISLTNAMIASVILAMQPLVLYFFSVGYLKEKFDAKILIGSVVALFGVLLIVSDHKAGGSQSAVGGLILVASLFFDCFGVVTKKRLMGRFGALQIISLNFLIGSIPLLMYSWTNNEFAKITTIPLIGWLHFSYLVLMGSLGFVLYYFALKKVSVERSSVYNYLMPVVGVVASIFIINTKPDAKFIIGAAIVFLGLAISQVKHPHLHHLLQRHKH